jgi:hypothetical protein
MCWPSIIFPTILLQERSNLSLSYVLHASSSTFVLRTVTRLGRGQQRQKTSYPAKRRRQGGSDSRHSRGERRDACTERQQWKLHGCHPLRTCHNNELSKYALTHKTLTQHTTKFSVFSYIYIHHQALRTLHRICEKIVSWKSEERINSEMLKRENLVIRNRIGTSNTFHSSEGKNVGQILGKGGEIHIIWFWDV